MSAYTVSSIPSTVVTEHETGGKGAAGMYAIGILAAVIIIVVVVLAVTHKQNSALAQASLTPHYVQIPPPEAAVVSAQPPFGEQYPAIPPYGISPSNFCIPGSQYYPTCLSQTPVQYWTSGDPYCTAGNPYYPLCKDTQLHPLAAYRF